MLPDSDREDPVAESKTGGLVVAPKQMSSALGSLLANYGSMSESGSDEEPEGEFASILNLLQNIWLQWQSIRTILCGFTSTATVMSI